MIFFFSGTGNTRWVAQIMAKATGERLIAMCGDDTPTHYTLEPDERIGFCFPVHGWQPPKVVRRFIARLSIDNPQGHYCYALCTCGDSVGLAMEMLDVCLAAKGLKTDSRFSFVMPESYVALPFMLTDTPQREQSKLENARLAMPKVTDCVSQRRKGVDEIKRGPLPWVLSHVIGAVFNAVLITDKPFRVDADRCAKCGVCAKVCPMGNIKVKADGLPEWKHHGECTACLACYHHCPRHAINYGPLTHRRGQYYFGRRKDKAQQSPAIHGEAATESNETNNEIKG